MAAWNHSENSSFIEMAVAGDRAYTSLKVKSYSKETSA